jgi:hypothetical protein
MGPSILKKVFIFSALRTGATFFIAGLNKGAWRKQTPACSISFLSLSWSVENRYPKYSRILEDPQEDETP